MSLQNTLQSFARAAFKLHGSPFHSEITLITDGIQIVMTTGYFRQMRRCLWHDLELTRLPDWGSIVHDDMKQQLIARSRIT